jgi:hypothetical protein
MYGKTFISYAHIQEIGNPNDLKVLREGEGAIKSANIGYGHIWLRDELSIYVLTDINT